LVPQCRVGGGISAAVAQTQAINYPGFASVGLENVASPVAPFPYAKSPCPTLRSSRDQMGDGSSPCSLSRAGIWRHISAAASFPTLFSTASGVFGLVAGPPSIPFSGTTELLSEAFQLASTDGCATSLQTRLRHVCDFVFASQPFSIRSAAAFAGAFARCHGSHLLTLRLLLIHRLAVSVLTSPTYRKVFTGLARTTCPSRCVRSLCSAFRRFSFG
jgi:hypothetical protein